MTTDFLIQAALAEAIRENDAQSCANLMIRKLGPRAGLLAAQTNSTSPTDFYAWVAAEIQNHIANADRPH